MGKPWSFTDWADGCGLWFGFRAGPQRSWWVGVLPSYVLWALSVCILSRSAVSKGAQRLSKMRKENRQHVGG